MEVKKNIPALRFPEFEGAWIKKKLREIATFSKGKGISKSDIVENGKLECIRYGELYTTYGETIDRVVSKTNISADKLVLSEPNDVIIPASGETQIDIATASCVLREGIALGGDLNILKTIHDGVFLSYYLNNKSKLDIANLAQGISVVHLYASQLSLLSINIPSLSEQKKIACFFTAIDQKIKQLKLKKEKLVLYKRGVAQKLFSQELRFKDVKGKEFPKWEKKKLEDIAYKNASNIAANAIEANEGDYIIYGASGVLKKVNFYREEEEYISIVKDGAGVGRVFLCEAKTSVLGTLDIIKPISGNLYYLYYYLQQTNFLKYITGSTIPHIYFSDYKSKNILYPSIEEQTKIANFLSAIDEKINAVQLQIEKTTQWKKGLLQKMFI